MQSGWSITIETTNGVVGLWTSWLENGFKLFYPLGVNVPDEVVTETLNVEVARAVKDKRYGSRLWAKYYSQKLPNYGRVWIDQAPHHMYSHTMYTIEEQKMKGYYCGHSETNTISTFGCDFSSSDSPEAPNCQRKYIKDYREPFIQLLVRVAKLVGEITAINLDSGLVLYTPETLKKNGYKVLKTRGEDKKEYLYARDVEKNFEIMLRSGNSMVSWITVIRYPSTNELTAENLIELLNKFDNSEGSCNVFPLIKHLAEQAEVYKNY